MAVEKRDAPFARLMDLARAAARDGQVRYSKFLEPSALADARMAARQAGVELKLWGGYAGAERVLAAFYEAEAPECFPIARLRVHWNGKYAKVEHRDLLGALMGLGLTRECLGDIAVFQDEADLFVGAESARYLADNLAEAGRAKLVVREAAGEEFIPPEPKGHPLRATVSSMRLDALVAAGYRLSRGDAQALIAKGLVKLNHVPELRSDASVSGGDLLSARGLGRLRVEAEPEETKKGRLSVLLFRFGD